MNIFVLDNDPVIAASYHCNTHVMSGLRESLQMLKIPVRIELEKYAVPKSPIGHLGHPCSVWARETQANYMWLVQYMSSLLVEYDERYEETSTPEKFANQRGFINTGTFVNIMHQFIPTGKLTPFAQAMPISYRNADPVKAYRAYYKAEKINLFTEHETKPEWLL